MEQDTKNTALLVMDMQEGILGGFPGAAPLLNKVAKAIAGARDKKIPVIYVVVGFRKGAPEVSLNNKSFGAGKERFAGMNMDEFMKIHPDIAPCEGEVTVTKRRISAFTGSDLDVILRAFNIQHLVLTGISTSGVMLATLVEAADKDYRLTVLSDCCADADEEAHRILINNIFSKRANVLTAEEWCKP
jgi:nicotinamidase-related amidase